MDATPTPLHSDAPLGARRAIIRRNPDDMQEVEMVEATWGSNPRFSAGVAFRFVRAEGQTFPSYRCLIPAPKFHIRSGERTFRVTFDGGNFFYLAAIWRRSGSRPWETGRCATVW
jgi:putative SOS response-associated peptidase YedK